MSDDFDLDKMLADSRRENEEKRTRMKLPAPVISSRKSPSPVHLSSIIPSPDKTRVHSSSSTSSSSRRKRARTRRLTPEFKTLSEDDLRGLRSKNMISLVKRWGYSVVDDHSNFESETHQYENQPWGRMVQHYTDSIFRPLAKIQQANYNYIIPFDMKPFDTRDPIPVEFRAVVCRFLKKYVNKTTLKYLHSLRTLCHHSNDPNLQKIGGIINVLLNMVNGQFENAPLVHF